MVLQTGPAPMFVLQLLLYWMGIALIAGWANKRGRPGLGVALACVGLLPAPFALTGAITKDGLMAGFLGCAAGLLLGVTWVRPEPHGWPCQPERWPHCCLPRHCASTPS